MKITRKLTVCEKILRFGEDTTPEVAKVRDAVAFGCITSGDRRKSEAYQKFLSRAKEGRG